MIFPEWKWIAELREHPDLICLSSWGCQWRLKKLRRVEHAGGLSVSPRVTDWRNLLDTSMVRIHSFITERLKGCSENLAICFDGLADSLRFNKCAQSIA